MSLDDIIITPLKRIPTMGGDILHFLKKTDEGFNGFGESYFSWINKGVIKAWKYHQCMTLNLVVPVGEVIFVFHKKDKYNDYRTEIIGEDRYVRLTVPPKIWFGFQGRGSGNSLIMNFADIPHRPDEILRKTLSEFDYNWSNK